MVPLTVRAGGCHIVAAVPASASFSAWHYGDSLDSMDEMAGVVMLKRFRALEVRGFGLFDLELQSVAENLSNSLIVDETEKERGMGWAAYCTVVFIIKRHLLSISTRYPLPTFTRPRMFTTSFSLQICI